VAFGRVVSKKLYRTGRLFPLVEMMTCIMGEHGDVDRLRLITLFDGGFTFSREREFCLLRMSFR
jgi:hypothetical protein